MTPTKQVTSGFQPKYTKAEISEKINKLRGMYYYVSNRNSKAPLPQGMAGDTDFFIAGKNQLVFIEVKIGKDTLSPEQIQLGEILIELSNHVPNVYYFIENGERVDSMVDWLLTGNYKNLKLLSEGTHHILFAEQSRLKSKLQKGK